MLYAYQVFSKGADMNDSTLRCGYCNQFATGKIKRSGGDIIKKCAARQIEVDFNHKTCKYFDPSEFFFCEKHGQRISFAICLSSRRNFVDMNKYLPCKKCRQFDQEIKELVSKYYLDANKIKNYNPDMPGRKLKRRNKTKRTLKRRTKKPTRKIRRRN
jgi:hypothetical protein